MNVFFLCTRSLSMSESQRVMMCSRSVLRLGRVRLSAAETDDSFASVCAHCTSAGAACTFLHSYEPVERYKVGIPRSHPCYITRKDTCLSSFVELEFVNPIVSALSL